MITNTQAFEEDALPREVLHRHDKMNRLATALKPVVEGDRPEPSFLFGPAGAGKTCVARTCCQRLKQETFDVNTHYLIVRDQTRFALLSDLARELGVAPSGRPNASADLLDRLRDASGHHVIILDEVDQLRDRDVLEDLYHLRSVTMLGIANDEVEFFGTLDAHSGSRLSTAKRLRFNKYTDEELIAILEDRADWGLHEDAVGAAQLAQIARAADGDARKAIAILRSAARLATDRGQDHITSDLIDDEAVSHATQTLREEQLTSLSRHCQTLFEILDDADGTLDRGTLTTRYHDAVDDPRSDRMVSEYLNKLESYELIERLGPPQSRRFRVVEP